ncbi:MAG: endolytic transglycosylase MltG [Deltaproteobacteria bacterium]|nr:endolytic transglycosylase MltG [Deltaproteobacteria bacterium]
MKKLLLVVVAVVFFAGGVAGGVWTWLSNGSQSVWSTASGESPAVAFVVPKGATGQGLGKLLVEQNLIGDVRFWKFHLWQRAKDGKPFSPKAGKHELKGSMTLPEIAAALERSPAADDEPFAMIEGWRLRDTDAALADKGWIKAGDYLKATQSPGKFKAPFPLPTTTLEGYLYPETYRVIGKPGFDVDVLVQRQIDTFVTRFYEPQKAAIASSGRSLDDIVRMASMLEREEPLPAQRPTVAGVLWKRIDKGYALGVDATSRYGLAEWNDRKEFLKRLRDPDDPYNTRLKKGLPPTPIGAPTVASLIAALNPEDNEFFYYLHDADKVLHPSRNGEEHEALRKKYNVY